MDSITRIAFGETSDETRRVRFRSNRGRASPIVTGCHARVTLLAFQLLDSRETALAYLNNYHEALGGRPIDLAGDGGDGLDRVIADLNGQTRARSIEQGMLE